MQDRQLYSKCFLIVLGPITRLLTLLNLLSFCWLSSESRSMATLGVSITLTIKSHEQEDLNVKIHPHAPKRIKDCIYI